MTPEVFRWFRLGQRGMHYVTEHLDSGKPLSTELQSVVSGSGYVYALLPSDIDSAAIEDFSSGGKVGAKHSTPLSGAQRIPTADQELALHIQTFLGGNEAGICIFENFAASPQDRSLASAKGVVACGPHVYHVVTSRHRQLGEITSVLRESRTTLEFVGALTTDPGLDDPFDSRGRSISENEIAAMARAVVLVMVGAYDGESVVAWSATPLK